MILLLLVLWFFATPLKNIGVSSSVGMMTFPTEWENHPNVPNHQPTWNIPVEIVVQSPSLSNLFQWSNQSLIGFSNGHNYSRQLVNKVPLTNKITGSSCSHIFPRKFYEIRHFSSFSCHFSGGTSPFGGRSTKGFFRPQFFHRGLFRRTSTCL